MLTRTRIERDVSDDGFGNISQNEKSDSVVRWGQSHNKIITQRVDPISEDSFGPADPMAQGAASRSPASSAAATQIIAAEAHEKKLAAKTIVRNLAKQKAHQEIAVIVNDLGFFPSNITVTQGIPVRLFVTGSSKKSQCFMMDAYGIRRQIQNQKVEEITFTPDESGTFAFTCPMNGAKGTMLVKELELGRMPANLNINVSKATNEDQE
jgi:plastocyanin domain-containing protein